ncbi:hypothetical protein JOC77_001570 [Peribacillus deserti]|uniref:Uncharacterized protein n=1 Tax=Peribacillus deserti TaxID=673318 RepID=A0ABS2QG65_9BACI|nr:hypothetical protein [Peribacillus deserti]MBM7692143.1 hypothetical protein [Peribacillus deserti]
MKQYRVDYFVQKHGTDDIRNSIIVNSVADEYEIVKLGKKQITKVEGVLSQNISITTIAPLD